MEARSTQRMSTWRSIGLLAWVCATGLRADIPLSIEQAIPPGNMTATASHVTSGEGADRAIDGDLGTRWRTDAALPQWIQLDLGDTYWIGAIRLYSGDAHRNRGYELYIADEPNPVDWGEALAAGELPNATGFHDVTFDPAAGRYLRLIVISRWSSRSYLHEFEVYRVPLERRDRQTGYHRFTNSDTVDITLPRMPGYNRYQITESAAEPVAEGDPYDPDALPSGLTYTFIEPFGDDLVTLYAWFKDTTETLDPVAIEGRIIYTTEAPVAAALATFDRETYAGQPVNVAVADLDTGSHGGTTTVSMVEYDIGVHHIGLSIGGGSSVDPLVLGPGIHTVTLTVTNRAGTAATTTSDVTIADAGDTTTTGDVTWSGGAGVLNPEWFRGQNWSGGEPPAKPTTGTINYGTNGTDVVGLIVTDRQVGGLLCNNVTASHTLDLGGNTLTVAGVFRSRLNGILTLTNGTLRIGTDTVAGDLTVGSVSSSPTTPTVLRLAPGMTYDGYRVGTIRFDTATATHVNHQNPRLDLRGVTVAGGVLGAENIHLDTNYRNAAGSYIAIDETTSISAIAVTNEFRLDGGQRRGRIFIGDPNDPDRRLPPNIDIRVGGSPAQRGSLLLAHNCRGDQSNRDVTLAAAGGGRIDAYLTDLIVMRFTGSGNTVAPATLDLSAMTDCLIDTLHFETGVNVQGILDGKPQGTVRLSAGTMIAGTVVIGASAGEGFGRFETSNTVVTVTNSLLLDLTGEITIDMGGAPMGIDVDGLFDDGGGRLHVNFLEAPSIAGATNWALRVAGDVTTTLNAMEGSGRLTANGTFAGWQTAVVADESYTYFAMVDENMVFPPVAVAQDATFEIEPAGTVWVDISEVDAGSYDPSERTPVYVTMSKDGAGGPFATNLSFDAVGDHPVVVKIEVGEPVVDADTDTATVSMVDLDPGTQGGVTWLGDASTALMDRREWWWKGNWLGGAPPANPMAGTITFAQYGQDVIGLLEQDREVGGISLPNQAYTHELNLGGNRLAIAGSFENQLTGSLILTNGILRIGTEASTGSFLAGGSGGASTPCITILRPGMLLDTYRVDEIRMGLWPVNHINNQNARLYLRGVALAGGELRANSIRIVNTYRQGLGSYIALDTNSVINAIVATNGLFVGTGTYRGRSFIGDPDDPDRRLPPDVDIRVGTPTLPGSLVVGQISGSGGGTANINLTASSGGDIEAWLTDLIVARHTGIDAVILNGTLDLSAMNSCLVDVTTIEIGRNTHATEPEDVQPRGTLRLPPGTVTAGDVILGDNHSSGFGLLALSNTAFTVTNALTVAKTGAIEVDIGAEAAGIDIGNADIDAFSMHADATLALRFLVPPSRRPHYGLRWAGDHASTLRQWIDAGRLTVDDGVLSQPAHVFLFQGATHVGIPPPRGTLLLMR